MSPVLKPKYKIIMFNFQEEPIPENLNHVMTDVEVAQSVEQAIAALDIVSCQIFTATVKFWEYLLCTCLSSGQFSCF